MRVSRTPPEIILDQVQLEQLEALTRASSASQTEALRARIILLAALNRTNEEIADELQTTEQTVCNSSAISSLVRFKAASSMIRARSASVWLALDARVRASNCSSCT